MNELNEAVRGRYAGIALQMLESQEGSCCASGDCCGGGYDAQELAELGVTEGASLGCGNPLLLADLKPGETVLDLGSGAGLDVLLSARRVGPDGRAFGVDMTDEMLALAERNRARAGVANATFLNGSIEALPLEAASVDVVISNCVINFAEDKAAVLGEAFRVLRPGGRFAVADMVEIEELPPAVKSALDAWAGCIAGSISMERYRALLLEVGFGEPEFEIHDIQEMPGDRGKIGSAYIRARKPGAV